MRNASRFFIFSVLIMIVSWYLLNARYNNYLLQVFFWGPVVGVLLIVAYQIIKLEEGTNQYLLVFVEILALSSLIRTMFIPNVAFYGYDSYHEYLTAVEISRNGWTPSVVNVELSYTINFPILHFLGISISEMTGASLLSVARFLPLVFAIPSALILFLLSNRISGSERVGLLTVFGFSMLYQSQMFYTLFVRESIAFVMFLLTVYLYYMAIRFRKAKYASLAFLSSTVTILSHHLTALLLIMFFVLVYTSQYLLRKMGDYDNTLFGKATRLFTTKSTHFHLTFVLFLAVSLMIYWVSITNTPFQILLSIANEASFISGGRVALIDSLRYWIILGGEVAFALVFGLVSLLSIYVRRNTQARATSLDFAFLVWVVFMGVFSVAFALGRIYPEGSFAVARRFQPFAYPFLFMLSGYAVQQGLKNHGLRRKTSVVLVLIFLLFSVFQLYTYPRYLYSDYRGSDDVRNILLPEEYASVFWLNTTRAVGTDWDILGHAIFGLVGKYPYNPVEVFRGDITEFKYLVVRNIGPYSLTETDMEASLKFGQSASLNHIYSNGVVEIYHTQE